MYNNSCYCQHASALRWPLYFVHYLILQMILLTCDPLIHSQCCSKCCSLKCCSDFPICSKCVVDQ
jgi:hypothetical protein